MLNGVNLLLAVFVLPESHRPGRGAVDWRALNPLASWRWALAVPSLIPLLTAFLLISLVGQTYGTVSVIFVEDRFGWTATEVGLSLAMFGTLVALVQTLAIGPMIRWVGERETLLLGILCAALALLVFAFAQSGWIIFVTIPLLAFSGVGLPALRALQANAIDRDRQGQLQGATASLGSLMAILGPLVFSWVYAIRQPDRVGIVWVIGTTVCILAVPLVLTVPKTGSRTS